MQILPNNLNINNVASFGQNASKVVQSLKINAGLQHDTVSFSAAYKSIGLKNPETTEVVKNVAAQTKEIYAESKYIAADSNKYFDEVTSLIKKGDNTNFRSSYNVRFVPADHGETEFYMYELDDSTSEVKRLTKFDPDTLEVKQIAIAPKENYGCIESANEIFSYKDGNLESWSKGYKKTIDDKNRTIRTTEKKMCFDPDGKPSRYFEGIKGDTWGVLSVDKQFELNTIVAYFEGVEVNYNSTARADRCLHVGIYDNGCIVPIMHHKNDKVGQAFLKY